MYKEWSAKTSTPLDQHSTLRVYSTPRGRRLWTAIVCDEPDIKSFVPVADVVLLCISRNLVNCDFDSFSQVNTACLRKDHTPPRPTTVAPSIVGECSSPPPDGVDNQGAIRVSYQDALAHLSPHHQPTACAQRQRVLGWRSGHGRAARRDRLVGPAERPHRLSRPALHHGPRHPGRAGAHC
jgi:hypothetical protein